MTSPLELGDDERRSARRIVAAQTAGKLGDILADAKTVLTWLMTSVGAPAPLVSVLVPIRESGSMLPQLWLTGVVGRFALRKRAYVAGAIGQSLACGAMVLAALTLDGLAAGVTIVVALAGLALARAVCSIAGKDVLGRTVPKGARGGVSGRAESLAGLLGAAGSIAAIAWMHSSDDISIYAAIVVAAALAFTLSGLGYGSVAEPPAEAEDPAQPPSPQLRRLLQDRTLRRFVIVRGLLLGSALGAPYLVLFGQQASDQLSSLASFVLAAGTAKALSSSWWGRLSDRSGHLAMAWGGTVATAAGLVAIVLRLGLDLGAAAPYVWPALYFVFTVGYAGVRVGRKTYVVDMAGGDRRTAYVAASNTAIAIALLGFGAVGAVVQAWSATAALGMLVLLMGIGSVLALRLPVEQDET